MNKNKLKTIFRSILKLEYCDNNQSFFALGGNSLQALQLMNSINENFSTEIQMNEVFQYSTIDKLADLIDEKSDMDLDSVEI